MWSLLCPSTGRASPLVKPRSELESAGCPDTDRTDSCSGQPESVADSNIAKWVAPGELCGCRPTVGRQAVSRSVMRAARLATMGRCAVRPLNGAGQRCLLACPGPVLEVRVIAPVVSLRPERPLLDIRVRCEL